jgi:hypothetical protein
VLRHLKSANPDLGPECLSKIDSADGFYCIWVRARDVPKLGVLFPSTDGEEYLVGIPLAFTMGWTESPNIFTVATETVTDVINNQLPLEVKSEAHVSLVALSTTKSPAPAPAPSPVLHLEPLPRGERPRGAAHNRTLLALWDMYVDGFMGLVQVGARTRSRVKCALLHTLDTVLHPLDSEDSVHRQEPASINNMEKGESAWTP